MNYIFQLTVSGTVLLILVQCANAQVNQAQLPNLFADCCEWNNSYTSKEECQLKSLRFDDENGTTLENNLSQLISKIGMNETSLVQCAKAQAIQDQRTDLFKDCCEWKDSYASKSECEINTFGVTSENGTLMQDRVVAKFKGGGLDNTILSLIVTNCTGKVECKSHRIKHKSCNKFRSNVDAWSCVREQTRMKWLEKQNLVLEKQDKTEGSD